MKFLVKMNCHFGEFYFRKLMAQSYLLRNLYDCDIVCVTISSSHCIFCI